MTTTEVIATFAALGTVVAALAAVVVYLRNSKLERAKWALSLYEKFYERKELKEIRDILDSNPDNASVSALVLKCSSEFTDYLNFFEFVAFLKKEKHLTESEVKALFDYYLKCLSRHPRVTNFIRDNGYEELDLLLKDWK